MITASDFMGDDGHGNCVGCLQPIDRITPDCPVCLSALEALAEWGADGIDPEKAQARLDQAVTEAMALRR